MAKFINKSNSRLDEQRKVMDEIAEQGHCPFCSENLSKYHKKPILKDGKFWILTDNQWPYEKMRNHMLAIHKKHIENLTDIEPQAMNELITMFNNECLNRNIRGGSLVIRFGSDDNASYGNSVLHLHAHLLEPDLDQISTGEKIKICVAKK